jgi:hypothetical protein
MQSARPSRRKRRRTARKESSLSRGPRTAGASTTRNVTGRRNRTEEATWGLTNIVHTVLLPREVLLSREAGGILCSSDSPLKTLTVLWSRLRPGRGDCIADAGAGSKGNGQGRGPEHDRGAAHFSTAPPPVGPAGDDHVSGDRRVCRTPVGTTLVLETISKRRLPYKKRVALRRAKNPSRRRISPGAAVGAGVAEAAEARGPTPPRKKLRLAFPKTPEFHAITTFRR